MIPEHSTTVDVATGRRSAEAFDRGDIDGVLAMYAPDAVLDMSPVGVGVFEGREAIRGFYEDWRASYEDFEQVIEEACDLGNGVSFGVVAARGRLHGSAAGSTFRMPPSGSGRTGWSSGTRTTPTSTKPAPTPNGSHRSGGRRVSHKNVEIARVCIEAFDRSDLEAAADFLDPDVEWDNTVLIDEEVIHGREAVKTYWERILSTSPFVHENHRFIEVGDRVCVLADLHGRGARSGVEGAHPCGYALTLRDGLITRSLFFFDQAHARQATGLEA
jgi:ketosteroid isomerase-like protein